ncbi:MAG: SDR family oxidoreductase [Verrucomicrobiota bacterium]
MSFLDQCTALITGASSGLGMEFARQLAPRASTLILVARRADRLEALRRELDRPGLTIHCRETDLADDAQLDDLVGWLVDTGIPVNFLVNNAGLGDHGSFASSDWERVRQMLGVNIGALTKLTHGVLPILRTQSRAAILNVSSVAGFIPIPKMAVYAASKAYVTSFTEALRAELRESAIRVTTLCPGPVSTEFGSVASRESEPDPARAPQVLKIPAQKVVAKALRAVEHDRARVIPGLLVGFVMLLTAMLPMFIMRLVMGMQARRTPMGEPDLLGSK